MKRSRRPIPAAALAALLAPAGAQADVWDLVFDYSTTHNPHRSWAYGRKWTTTGGFDVMAVPWGGSGWFFGNWGHGGPSFHGSGGNVNGWSKNNTNGLAAVRWTAPRAGTFAIDAAFRGNDSRGVDNHVFVAVNNVQVFSGRVTGNGTVVPYAAQGLSLAQGDTIDLVIEWAGGVHSEYGWTAFIATITDPVNTCYANCDGSMSVPPLNVADFSCFLTRYAAGESYANCDGGTTPPVLNVQDFSCFLAAYAAGCPG